MTWEEVWDWLETVPKIDRNSWRAAQYIKDYNVFNKIRQAKVEEEAAALTVAICNICGHSGKPRAPTPDIARLPMKPADRPERVPQRGQMPAPRSAGAGASIRASVKKSSSRTAKQRQDEKYNLGNGQANKGKPLFKSKRYRDNLKLVRRFCDFA